MQGPEGALAAKPMQQAVRDALIAFMALPSQAQAEATGSSAFAAGQVKRQVKPEGA